MRISTAVAGVASLGTLFVLLVPTWNAPPAGQQMGFRASSMVQFEVQNKFALAKNAETPPANIYGVGDAQLSDTRPVSAVYQNVQSTKDVTAGQFMRLQVAITNWIAPEQGCAFCHAAKPGVTPAAFSPNGPTPDLDWASDAVPQKAVARTMIGMTQHLNADWSSHVAPSGVTCFTCHRGQNVPAKAWYPRDNNPPRDFVSRQEDWHESATTVHDFFPTAGDEEYILQDTAGKSQGYVALTGPGTHPSETLIVKRMYEFMMTMADDIGVNCGYCHNSRALFDWGQSTPKRWIGMSGIEMTRAINRDVLLPLHQDFPQILYRVGMGEPPTTPAKDTNPQPGNAFANCGSCHYGAPVPLNGLNLVKDFPELAGAKP